MLLAYWQAGSPMNISVCINFCYGSFHKHINIL
jgi:hypothetical protein